jgi:hypothetical protein
MRIISTLFVLLMATAFAGMQLQAQAFQPNSIVVLRAGSPDSANSNRSREVFLHEIDTSTGATIQIISISRAGTDKLTVTGTATTEGMLKRSVNKAYLTFGGYDLEVGVSSPTSSAAAAMRVIARVSSNGSVDLSTKVPLSEMHGANAMRAVASTDGTAMFAAGGSVGLRYVPFGGGSGVSKNLSATVTNMRSIGIFDNTIYMAHTAGTAISRVYRVPTSLTTLDSVGAENLPDIPTTSGITASDFWMADLSDAVPGVDVLYIADEGSSGGIIKFSLVGGKWVESGRILNTLDATNTYRTITGEKTSTGVVLFAVRNGGTQLVKIYENGGYNAAPSLLANPQVIATAVLNTAFRGVAFAPQDISLPLTLSRFTGSNQQGMHKLNWITANEQNTAHFDVQLSRNGLDFSAIGQVTAQNTAGNHQYSFVYNPVAKGDFYYRLKMVDRDGSFRMSQVIRLQSVTGSDFTVFPNPSHNGMVLVTHDVATKGTTLRLIAADGRTLNTIPVQEGSTQTSINIQHSARGLYRVVLSHEGGVTTKALMLQ